MPEFSVFKEELELEDEFDDCLNELALKFSITYSTPFAWELKFEDVMNRLSLQFNDFDIDIDNSLNEIIGDQAIVRLRERYTAYVIGYLKQHSIQEEQSEIESNVKCWHMFIKNVLQNEHCTYSAKCQVSVFFNMYSGDRAFWQLLTPSVEVR